MRRVLFAALLTASGAACGDHGAVAPSPDLVGIFPYFIEAYGDRVLAQIGENGGGFDYHLDGLTDGGWPNGMGAAVGSTIVLHVHSPLYQSLDTSFVVPDTITRSDKSQRRNFFPIIRLSRLVPALLRAQWAADFTGPTVRIEILAPHGLGGVRITAASAYWQACFNASDICEPRFTGVAFLSGTWQPDSAGWVHLSGRWADWPNALPPIGYGGPDSSRVWGASLGVNIEDDLGHKGRGYCGGAPIPSSGLELTCGVLFQR